MEPEISNPPDLDQLLETIRARVDQRRREGRYPPDLEKDLGEHFGRIVGHRLAGSPTAVRERLTELYASMGFDARRIPMESTVPAGRFIHRLIGRLVGRQTQGVFEQVHEFAKAVHSALETLEESYANATGQIDAILERLSSYERVPEDHEIAVRELSRRLVGLEETVARQKFRPWFKSSRFEKDFQGSPEEYVELYRDLSARFEGYAPVLDIGCGRGRFLELLTDTGIEATGVDMDSEQIAIARKRGLKVEEEEGLSYLAGLADGSLGGAVMIQVVEHIGPHELVEVVALLERKLRVGGLFIAETINPTSLYVFAHTFYMDPTHVQPIHPAYLSFLFKEAGFANVDIEWRSPPPEKEVLEESGVSDGIGATFDENVRRLNKLLFSAQNYALIAVR